MAKSGVYIYEIADSIGVSNTTLIKVCRKFGIQYKDDRYNSDKKENDAKPVKRIDKLTHEEKLFDSVKDAADYMNVGKTHIYDVCNGKRKSSYGYYWEYISND